MALERDIEIIDLPTGKGEFSVVQLFLDQRPVMVCGYAYHSEILENYLRSQKIQPEKITIKNMLNEREIPALEGSRYRVVGMGRARMDPEQKQFQLPYGASVDYGIGPDWKFREQLRKQFQGWNIQNSVF